MDWKEIAGKIAKAAPMVGSLLGPAGTAAGGLLSLIGSTFGLTDMETTPERINQIIEQDPQALLKFKELEFRHKETLEGLLLKREELKVDEERIRLADVANARNRQVKSEEVTGKKDINLYAIAWLYIIGYFSTIIIISFLAFSGSLPELMPNYIIFLLGNLFGALTSGVGAIVQYFFGSSKSSGDKTKMMLGMKQIKETKNVN